MPKEYGGVMPMAEMIGEILCTVTTTDCTVSDGRKQSQLDWIHGIIDICDNGGLITPLQTSKHISNFTH
jgi:hypothetical protein